MTDDRSTRRRPPPSRAHARLAALFAVAALGCAGTPGPEGADGSTSDAATSDGGMDAAAPMDAGGGAMDGGATDGGGAMDADTVDAAGDDAGGVSDGGGMRRDAGAVDAAAGDASVDVFTDADFTGTELLGRPTQRSITVHVVPTADVELYYEFGTAPGTYAARTTTQTGAAGAPIVTVLEPLAANTRYFYRLRHRAPGASTFEARAEHSFTTQRPPGASFTFTVQADSHLDDRSNFGVYESTLANVLADAPDFHVDLGDTFMCEKHTTPFMAATLAAMDPATVDARYAFDRANFARIGHSVPLFLVNGNHEGESGWFLDGTANNLAVWTTLSRKRYFPNPEADAFYSSTTTAEPFVGQRQAFYAFEWGDALFITLDPYWYTRLRPTADRWRWTLGEAQYQWLRGVLERSTARYRFVFLHHLLGGVNSEARGGVEAAPYFEWGGRDMDGTDTFATHRPGWTAPIHALLRDHHVTAVFHGHDHVYVRQELDGVVYQEVPQPSAANFTNGDVIAAEGGYTSGVVRSSSGHLRVSVSPERVVVDYVRATPPAGMRIPDGGLAGDSYTLLPR